MDQHLSSAKIGIYYCKLWLYEYFRLVELCSATEFYLFHHDLLWNNISRVIYNYFKFPVVLEYIVKLQPVILQSITSNCPTYHKTHFHFNTAWWLYKHDKSVKWSMYGHSGGGGHSLCEMVYVCSHDKGMDFWNCVPIKDMVFNQDLIFLTNTIMYF